MKTKQLNVRVTEADFNLVNEMAESMQVSQSVIIHFAITMMGDRRLDHKRAMELIKYRKAGRPRSK